MQSFDNGRSAIIFAQILVQLRNIFCDSVRDGWHLNDIQHGVGVWWDHLHDMGLAHYWLLHSVCGTGHGRG